MNRKSCMFGLAFAALLGLGQAAQAYDPYGLSYGGWGFSGYPNAVGWNSILNNRVPPYFALHPPVYYSGRIHYRSYGDSPFASVGGCGNAYREVEVIESEPATPVMIQNPFVRPSAQPQPLPSPTDAAPESPVPTSVESGEFVINPFYNGDVRIAKRAER